MAIKLSSLSAHRPSPHRPASDCFGIVQPPATARRHYLISECDGQPLEVCSTIRQPAYARISDARGEPLDKFERALGLAQQ